MSLYGTGRSEGIATVALMALLTGLVHVLGSLQAIGPEGLELASALRSAAVPALGGALCYRFLRAQGRSRYAGFLAGTAYAMSPWLCTMGLVPREQLAAALAPLALEAASRCAHPGQRRTWLPWTALCMATPFLAGPSVVALLAMALVAIQTVPILRGCDLSDRAQLKKMLAGSALLTTIAAASLVWIDPLGSALHITELPRPAAVLAAHRQLGAGIDLPALMRLAGPVLMMFAALGILRRQRHANIVRWLTVAVAGALPTFWCSDTAATTPGLLALLPTAAWWLPLLAITVLGAAGLDDFLDLPLRRRTALPWLLALAVAATPLLPLTAQAPEQEWPLTGTILLLALLMPSWRKVGILRFKNVLATATLLALAVPALQVLPRTPAVLPVMPPAMPLWESADCSTHLWDDLREHPAWHYSGLLGVFAFSSTAALFAWRRRRNAMPVPSSAKAAIKKKAKPAQRR